ncbi:hypothetical protein NEPAR06_0146 [Nematocida parisii]|uniref:Uncharacterized protein n=1 Tax=Nematocida parisii (strain ERTm3) TaxID=935791 RepID=I3EDH9_NEMP3|nr:uncharacterized protein NEPG_00552 [Nematocida parisii ERTm1]EIJ87276.1 hypothetical protein NEQG_02611 [Nematocida parisii ERTm3]KAI5130575.1 hypothetical protein NEPAR03_2131 [Nematocida parisii]KAI5167027.1 hypothetical protein NEIRO02_1616 [Nematocida sp. AWRm79]KAI5184187.1 hypothetical protein NEIRO03_1641 [Nematocida sp. AWRm78]OAG33021.1 hypothetical protein NEIG_00839 [Nematocida sp. ERTm5]|eukprot:XP_013058383.1 hypothetical protein NEPG_00552 [Nematocida parisii ERTm1]
MQRAMQVLKQPIEQTTHEQLDEIQTYVENEEKIYALASEVEQLLSMYIEKRDFFFGHVSRDI